MTPPAERTLRCSDTARRRGDPPLGTAPMIRRWLLIEHPGPWPVEALSTPDFEPELRATLSAAARAVVGRVLLVRRPGRSVPAAARSWAVVVDGGVHWGRWRTSGDLRDAATALRHPPAELRHEPVLLVCAHGVHDTCCAVRGRPVAAALAQQWPEATWECSHVGGDRFAPNVVVLPDGVYYGYLDSGDVVGVVQRHLGGELAAAFLRGITRYPPAAQVAIGEAHRRWGPYGADEVYVLGLSQPAGDRWEIDLVLPGGRGWRFTVVTGHRLPAQLTCRAAEETSALDYTVVAARRTG